MSIHRQQIAEIVSDVSDEGVVACLYRLIDVATAVLMTEGQRELASDLDVAVAALNGVHEAAGMPLIGVGESSVVSATPDSVTVGVRSALTDTEVSREHGVPSRGSEMSDEFRSFGDLLDRLAERDA